MATDTTQQIGSDQLGDYVLDGDRKTYMSGLGLVRQLAGHSPHLEPSEVERLDDEREAAAWGAVGGEPRDAWDGGSITLSREDASVDGHYTPNELRRIADAQERYAELVEGVK